MGIFFKRKSKNKVIKKLSNIENNIIPIENDKKDINILGLKIHIIGSGDKKIL